MEDDLDSFGQRKPLYMMDPKLPSQAEAENIISPISPVAFGADIVFEEEGVRRIIGLRIGMMAYWSFMATIDFSLPQNLQNSILLWLRGKR